VKLASLVLLLACARSFAAAPTDDRDLSQGPRPFSVSTLKREAAAGAFRVSRIEATDLTSGRWAS
jgi:hypothetical protein